MKKVTLALLVTLFTLSIYSCRETTETEVDDVETDIENTGEEVEEEFEEAGEEIEQEFEEDEDF